jgi:hypothetical protein
MTGTHNQIKQPFDDPNHNLDADDDASLTFSAES